MPNYLARARGVVLGALPGGETDIASRAHGTMDERPTPGQASLARCPHDNVYRVAPAAEKLLERLRGRTARENTTAFIDLSPNGGAAPDYLTARMSESS